MEGFKENLELIFNPLIQSCGLSLKEITENQDRLTNVLNRINDEIAQIQKSNYLAKDEELNMYLDRLVQYKKRLLVVSTKIDKLQAKVDKIEKRFMKYAPPS